MVLIGIRDILLRFGDVEDDCGSEFEGRGEVVGFRMGNLGLAQMGKLELEVFDGVAVVAGLWRVEQEVVHDRVPRLGRVHGHLSAAPSRWSQSRKGSAI